MLRDKYKKLFFTEADEKINALNKAFMELEKNPENLSVANEAMRASHTLKSSAAAMNFMGISHIAHTMEDLFEQVRTKKHALEPSALEILFQSVDELSFAVREIKNGKPEPDMALALAKLKEAGSGIQVPSAKTAESPKKPDGRAPNTYAEPIEAIKVDVSILDRLMNLTEELLVEKMRLSQVTSSLELLADKSNGNESLQADSSKVQAGNMAMLKSSSENFNRLLNDLQYNVVQARMVPLGQIVERFPRMVRDLAKEEKKDISLEIQGQEIELDRTIIDRLGEPLIHLLRNAVDHGIEKNGKISLIASRERDKVYIAVENNGSKINWENVIEAAVSRGIIDKTTQDAYKRDREKWKTEIENLIFHPQLSTKENVTETSGRGIGLYIVKSVVEGFGGSIAVHSSEEKTSFTLTLPLTLAIIQALLVRVANQVFALPFSQIDRSVRVPLTHIKKAFDQEVAVVEEEDIPMVRLDKVFGLQKSHGILLSEKELQDKAQRLKTNLKAELMVIIKKENLPSAGLIIDEMIAEQDIVVKPFKGALKQSKGFAGVTLLGDGRPALILDVATLI